MVRVTRIDLLQEDDWERLRALRLAAFQQDGQVFGSSLEREAGLKEMHWRMRLRSSPWFVAVDATDGDVGLVCVISEPGAGPTDRHLVSLWVAPNQRGRGVADALMAFASSWAQADGGDTLSLWVTEDNRAATALYERCGFVATGESMPLARDRSRVEQRWERRLVP